MCKGKILKNLKLPGEDHYVHHKYIVLGLKDKKGEMSYLSLDKDRTGILAQIHSKWLKTIKTTKSPKLTTPYVVVP